MPSGFLHTLCARRACEQAGVTPVERDVMMLGAQGPDPLFTLGLFPLRLSSKPSRLGNILHEYRTGAFLMALCSRAKQGDGVSRAYALGFLTHYALDSTVHPYVYAQSYRADGTYSSTLHTSLEKQWDGLHYRRTGEKGTPELMPGPKETRAHWPQIAALLAGAIGDVFPEQNVTENTIVQALESTEKANRLTHSPRGIKYGFVWLMERVIGKPGLGTSQMAPRFPTRKEIENSEEKMWHSPFEPERERSESLSMLLAAAVHRASGLLKTAAQYFAGEVDEEALAAVIGNLGYDSGLESKP